MPTAILIDGGFLLCRYPKSHILDPIRPDPHEGMDGLGSTCPKPKTEGQP